MSRPSLRRLTAAALAMSLLAVAAACSDDDSESSDPPETTAVEDLFPVTVTADNGEVLIAEAPERIVSLSPSLTEMLYAIDADEQVVAVDKSSNFPEGTPMTDMSGFSPNVEAIAGYVPDLVVLSRDEDGAAAALSGLGIPTLVLPSADTIEDVYEEIEALGHATGHPEEAGDLVTDMQEDLAAVVEDLPVRDGDLTYFYELTDEYHSVTSDTFIGSLLATAGLRSIADGVDAAAEGFPQLTAEHILESDPDYVFLAHTDASGTDLAAVAARPGWSELQAVQQGHIVILPDDLASRWGPRVVDLLEAVVDALAAADSPAPTDGEE